MYGYSTLQKQIMTGAALFVFVCIGLILFSGSCRAETPEPKLLEPGIYDLPLILPKSLEPRRKEFRDDFIEAQRKLKAFADKHGWGKLTEPALFKQAEIYDSNQTFTQRLWEFAPEDKGKPYPKTYTACVQNDIFVSVTPEIFDEVTPDMREPKAFEKLLTHELAHRLHARIVHGDEEKMGPIWFWEGFAVNAANQYADSEPKLSDEEIWSIVDAKERGSYRKYKVVFNHFLKNASSLPDYVNRAAQANFGAWLKESKTQSKANFGAWLKESKTPSKAN